MPKINDAKILIVATNGFEQSELEVPKDKLGKAGAEVHLATPDGEAITGWSDGDWGSEVSADLAIKDANIKDYDALVLPGGQMNPDILRVNEDAMKLIREFVASGKTIAAICHAPWLLIEADAVKGRDMTCYKSIRTDLANAGANVKDEAVVVDQAIVTSRHPGDLDAFVAKIIEEVEEGRHARQAA